MGGKTYIYRNIFFFGIGPGGGGGWHSPLKWVGGAAGGLKPDPVTNRSAHKNTPCHNTQYTLAPQKKTDSQTGPNLTKFNDIMR